MRPTLYSWSSLDRLALFLPILAILAAAVVILGPRPARAADCQIAPAACLTETIQRSGNSRNLSVLPQINNHPVMDFFNVRLPGKEQFDRDNREAFLLPMSENGDAIYSVQACAKRVGPDLCQPWTRINRRFASVGECQNYSNQAIAAVVEQQRLGCNFGGDRWTTNADAHFNACMVAIGDWQGFLNGEANARAGELATCKQRIDAVNAANTKPSKPIKTTGKAKDGSGKKGPGAGVLTCRGGGMAVSLKEDDIAFINFAGTAEPASAAPPGPGQCSWTNRVVGDSESHRIAMTITKHPQGQALIDAARNGGMFKVIAAPLAAFVMVNEIVSVDGAGGGAAAANPEPEDAPADAADEDGGNAGADVNDGDDVDGGDNGGGVVASASCPAGGATVNTDSAGVDMLNVRFAASKESAILGQIPNGSPVQIAGACAGPGAGFTKKANGAGNGSWCRVTQPEEGCVLSEFLEFGGGGGKVAGAGFAKKAKPKKPADDDGDAANGGEQGFAGKWTVDADDGTSYRMTFTQKGTTVNGTFNGSDGSKGSLKGKLKGNVLRFTWRQPADDMSGSGKFTLDGDAFSGSYSFSSNPDKVEGSWNGTRG